MNGYTTRSKGGGPPKKTVVTNPVLFEYGNGSIVFTLNDKKHLQTPNYLNDTIISFFMQYHLDNQVDEELKDRIHVFNSFFFSKIKSIKSSKCISRWLKGVEIFKKDFLIMPVCEKDHWALAIICYPASLPNPKQYQIPDHKLFEPTVLVLTSLAGVAPKVKTTIRKFLRHQWQQERGCARTFPIKNSRASGIRLICPKLPQQRNNYNCGVYILNYFYCFLKNPRAVYISMFRRLDMTNWFADNHIDIQRGRRLMTDVITKQIAQWRSVPRKEKEDSGTESMEIFISSPSQSEISLVEQTGTSNNSVIVIH